MGSTVYIADADRELCDLYRRFFTHHGWRVEISGGGLECLAQLRRSLPHLLVLDAQLPWGGADGLLAVMRDDPCLARIPVVLTSMGDFPQPPGGLVLPSVVRTLAKPFSLAVLLEIAVAGLGKAQTASKRASQEQDSHAFCS
jgi:DNA-binding response OmpR family regulator